MCIVQNIGMYFIVYIVGKSCVHEECIKKYIKIPPLMYIICTLINIKDVQSQKNNVHYNVHSKYIRKRIKCTLYVCSLGIEPTSQSIQCALISTLKCTSKCALYANVGHIECTSRRSHCNLKSAFKSTYNYHVRMHIICTLNNI